MTVGSISWRALLLVAALVCAPASASLAMFPLDVQDPAPRTVLVEWENSTDLSAVGVSYAAPVEASYSASGNVGTLVIPVESHEMIHEATGEPVPGTFSSVTIEIDLTTLEATSQAAGGQITTAAGPQGVIFTQNPLSTSGIAGYATSAGTLPFPAFCASQADVDALCATIPSFCGATCQLVPGAAYDVSSGELNLVGSQDSIFCVPGCLGPFELFSQYGDLRFSEVVVTLPSAGPIALLIFAGLAVASACRFLANP